MDDLKSRLKQVRTSAGVRTYEQIAAHKQRVQQLIAEEEARYLDEQRKDQEVRMKLSEEIGKFANLQELEALGFRSYSAFCPYLGATVQNAYRVHVSRAKGLTRLMGKPWRISRPVVIWRDGRETWEYGDIYVSNKGLQREIEKAYAEAEGLWWFLSAPRQLPSMDTSIFCLLAHHMLKNGLASFEPPQDERIE